MENQSLQTNETLETMIQFHKKVIDLYIDKVMACDGRKKKKKCHKYIKNNLSKMYDVDGEIKKYLKSDCPLENGDPGRYYSVDVILPDNSPESLDSIFEKLKCIDNSTQLESEFIAVNQVEDHFRIYLHNKITKTINTDSRMYRRIFNVMYDIKKEYLNQLVNLNKIWVESES
jgi:hypothetical protein